MAKDDVKLIQRGMNVQANDLAVPAGTPTAAVNVDFQRDGVAQCRAGFDRFDIGLPQHSVDADDRAGLGISRGTYDLFSRDHLFHHNNGMIFSYDTAGTSQWLSVPFAMPHKYAFHGNSMPQPQASSYFMLSTLGRMVINNTYTDGAGVTGLYSPFQWQIPDRNNVWFYGTIANTAAVALANGEMYTTPADALYCNGSFYVSDGNTIRKGHTIWVGSLTASGLTDGTGTAALFSGASWMATDGTTNIYVADNTNAIRKIVAASKVVTTLAGSITAGDSDGIGTAASFRTVSGLCYSAGFLYVSESAGHRIRKIDVATGSVTIFAGLLSPATSGFTNGTGTAARFNTPTGIEVIGDSLYTGDAGNNVVRRITTAGAVVTTWAGNGSIGSTSNAGMVGGLRNNAYLPSVVVRCAYTSIAAGGYPSGAYLGLECTAANSSIDHALCFVAADGSSGDSVQAQSDQIYHYARSPDSLPVANGPNKLDTTGPNAYSATDVRGVDTSSGVMFTTSDRARVLDVYSRLNASDPMPRLRPAGIDWPEAPSCTSTSGTTFAIGTSWAYRTVCGMTLPNGRIALGPPSERVVVSISSPTQDGSVTVYASPGLPYDGLPFVQVYRTLTVASTTDPGDQMFLCYEAPLTYGTAVTFTDSLPDALLGAELYTNSTSDGPGAASLPPPPFALDVASFNQSAVLSNYNELATLRFKVLGTSPLVTGTSTITLTAVGPPITDVVNHTFTLTAATITAVDSGQFIKATAGSAATNAVATARAIALVINRNAQAFMFRAIYDESDPGAVIISLLFPGRGMSLVVSDGANTPSNTTIQSYITFATNAPSAFAITSSVNSVRKQNQLINSDQLDPDSFPIINTKTEGVGAEAIQRLLPIAENLLVVKDDSILRLDSTYTSQIYDLSLSCRAPRSFARLQNQWIGLFTKGFVSLSASQPNPIGRPLDRSVSSRYGFGELIPSVTGNGTNVDPFASAAANDVTGNYICRFNRQTYVYNAFAQAWGLIDFAICDAYTQPAWYGSYLDGFVAVRSNQPRSMLKQIDIRQSSNTSSYVSDFYDVTYVLSAGVVSGNTLTASITVADNMSFPPASAWTGAVINGNTIQSLAYGSSTSAYSNIVATLAAGHSVTSFDAASVTTPIRMRVQYAASLQPGSLSKFGDVLATLERAHSGSLTCMFYNRRDYGDVGIGALVPLGDFASTAGISRVNAMAALVPSGTETPYAYFDMQRFATPAERSTDQQLVVELISQQALQSIAIKAVAIVIDGADTTKVKQ